MKVFKKLSMCILSGLLCLGIATASPAPAQAAAKVGNGSILWIPVMPEIQCSTTILLMLPVTAKLILSGQVA